MTQPAIEHKPETMGRRLASIRVLRGLTQERAAEGAGLSQSYLSTLENDDAESPALPVISRLADLYGVSLDYLVKGDAAAA
jgi:transcriptional regulator with XRE-family HTH domain